MSVEIDQTALSLDKFVGREKALNEFNRLFSYRRQKNAIYYPARGGLGKTWLLRRIIADSQAVPGRFAPLLIDFFELTHRSVGGLRRAIASRLGDADFPEFDYARCAEGFGCYGEVVKESSEIKPALGRAKNSGKPAVIDIKIEQSSPEGTKLMGSMGIL